MFGQSTELPQGEDTPLAPTTPYATSKLAAHMLVRNFRQQYGLLASNAIIFNHESPRKGKQCTKL
jgi:GDPmannose 4,6-dehydratase